MISYIWANTYKFSLTGTKDKTDNKIRSNNNNSITSTNNHKNNNFGDKRNNLLRQNISRIHWNPKKSFRESYYCVFVSSLVLRISRCLVFRQQKTLIIFWMKIPTQFCPIIFSFGETSHAHNRVYVLLEELFTVLFYIIYHPASFTLFGIFVTIMYNNI